MLAAHTGWLGEGMLLSHTVTDSFILHTSPEHLLCVTVRGQSFPFYLLSDFRSLSKPHCFSLHSASPRCVLPSLCPLSSHSVTTQFP